MTTTDVRKNYAAFLDKRNTLISIIDRQITLSESLQIDTWVENLQRLKQRVSNESFKVLIIGEFKRGKSTFINAMLGQDILPASPIPCTAIINEVKWGQSPQALLHYLKHEDGSQKEPKNIPVETIQEYVVIPEEPDDNYTTPYEKVEILYPLELCRSGVEVIDSPGLNEHATRSKVTEGYLPIVDAIVFVFTCEALASESEIEFIEKTLKPLGHEDLFFVCNKFDRISDKEKARVRKFAISKLAPLTSRGESGVFFISASNALDGRLEGDDKRVAESGVLILERELEEFLTNDRGRIKILEPTKELQELISRAEKTIPERRAMLQINREELERRFQEAQEPLKNLQIRREQITKRIDQFLSDMGTRIYDDAYAFFSGLDSKIEVWIEECELESGIDLAKINPAPWEIQKSVKSQVQTVLSEIEDYLTSKLEEEFSVWQKKVLGYVDSRLITLKEDIDARASEFLREVDKIRSQISTGSASTHTQEAVSSIQRLFYASGVNSTQGASAWSGGVFAFARNTVLASVLGGTLIGSTVTILAGFAGIFLGPIIGLLIPIIAVAVALAGNELKTANERIENRFREEISKKFREELSNSINVQSKQVSESIVNSLKDIKNVIDRGLASEIKAIEQQIESVRKDREKGQAAVNEKVQQLDTISKELNQLKAEIDDFTNQLTLL